MLDAFMMFTSAAKHGTCEGDDFPSPTTAGKCNSQMSALHKLTAVAQILQDTLGMPILHASLLSAQSDNMQC